MKKMKKIMKFKGKMIKICVFNTLLASPTPLQNMKNQKIEDFVNSILKYLKNQ